MPIVIGIIGLILVAVFWDQFVYLIGGALILLALFCAYGVYVAIKESNMSDEEFMKQENEKKLANPNYKPTTKSTNGRICLLLILTLAFSYGGYKVIDYNSKSIEENKIAYQNQQEKELNDINNKISKMDEKEKAIFDSVYDKTWDGSVSEIMKKQEAYDKVRKQIEEENKALQKKYDDQAKYEEWIAWQKQEKERKAEAELQEKYDQQAQYERWIEDQRKKGKLPEQIAAREAAAAAEKERKENTISLGDGPSKVKRLKGEPNSVKKQTTNEGSFLWYTYYKNGIDHSSGTITYQFHNSSLASITEY